MNIREALDQATRKLREVPIESASLEAELLLAHSMRSERAHILAFGEEQLTQQQEKTYFALIGKRTNHVPFAYLVGKRDFFGFEFYVNTYTLIPRPETELLVETIVGYIRERSHAQLSVLDVGTGSGCIIISIALAAPNAGFMMGIDRSKRALDVARLNAEKHHVEKKIQFKRYNMLSLMKDNKFDIIVANLPYLSSAELAEARRANPELIHEPQIALLGGKDGMLFQRQIIVQARKRLYPKGALFLEIGDMQGAAIENLAHAYLDPCTVEIKKDLCNRDRVAVIRTDTTIAPAPTPYQERL